MKEQNSNKGIFIPDEIMRDFSLSWNEKAVLTQIAYLTNNFTLYPINNLTLSAMLGIEERTIRSILSSLFNKKKIMFKRKTLHSRTRYVMLYDKNTIKRYQYEKNPQLKLEYKE